VSTIPRAAALDLGTLRDAGLEKALQDHSLHLTAADVERLRTRLERNPTLAELALVDSMWSEHCSYKSSRALLRRLPTEGPHVVLGPGADAGIVRLPHVDADGGWHFEGAARCIAVAHESHNHPSQLLPLEGASTGIGGIVRDVYCMGADVVGVMDALRFGDPSGEQGELARQIARGVVDGVAHYGNALGVPNLGGEVEFEAAFDDNCLVNVVALGTLEESEWIPSRAPANAARDGYALLLVGKPTDDSGLGGAAFASGALDTDEDTQERGAVQLPDPFFKRVLTEANRAVIAHLRQRKQAFAMKDLGAAGLGGASSEMAGELGLTLDLDAVHADRPGRTAAVLMVAETQERYILAIPQAEADAIRTIYEEDFELSAMVRGAGARVVGRFTDNGRFRAVQAGELHVDLATTWITQPGEVAWPRRAPRRAQPQAALPRAVDARDLEADLRALLTSLGGASRRALFGHYDSDVQGHTCHRPGDSDAGVVLPWRGDSTAIACAVAGAARVRRGEAWRAGAAAVCEAVRNVVCVGATPWALTDCLNFGSPETPECMDDLEECVRGLADAARTLGIHGHPDVALPFVSGNVSLYNESRSGRAIPPTPIVGCFGVASEVAALRSMVLKEPDNVLFHLGALEASLGQSLYAQATGQDELFASGPLPALDLDQERARAAAVLDAFAAGLLQACHDVSDGGVLTSVIEMSFGRLGTPTRGAQVRLPDDCSLAHAFCESPGYVCEVRPEDVRRFQALCVQHAVQAQQLGRVVSQPELHVEWRSWSSRVPLVPLAAAWRDGLNQMLYEEVSA
jgi:phosphoribosylformylglycinamidine synthase